MPNYTYANTVAAKQGVPNSGILTNNYEKYIYNYAVKRNSPQPLAKLGGFVDIMTGSQYGFYTLNSFPDAYAALGEQNIYYNPSGDVYPQNRFFELFTPGFQSKNVDMRLDSNLALSSGTIPYLNINPTFSGTLDKCSTQITNTALNAFINNVTTHVISCGSIDFGTQSGIFQGIYNNTFTTNAKNAWASGLYTNLSEIIAAFVDLSPAHIVVMGLTTPFARGSGIAGNTATAYTVNPIDWTDTTKIDRVYTEVARMNTLLKDFCREKAIVYVDLDTLIKDFYGTYHNANNISCFDLTVRPNTKGTPYVNKQAGWSENGTKHPTFSFYVANTILCALKEGYNFNVELFAKDDFYNMLNLKTPYNNQAMAIRYGMAKENFGASLVGGQVGTNNEVPFSVTNSTPSIHQHKDFKENISRSRPGSVTFGAGKATPNTQDYEAKN